MAVRTRRPRAASRAEACPVPCFNEALVSRLRATLPEAPLLAREATFLQALGDPTRLKIILALELGGELCVCDVAHVLGLSVSAISHQLRQLRHLGLVRYRTDGRMVYYSLALPEVVDWLARGRELLNPLSLVSAVAVE